ncbi:hypothetical protein L1887_49558 [Cichorium endivia]|nr:hypothetical protein L1887_49558 [Cichorium endivia]
MATNAKAEGSDFDFIKVIEENEITERLEDFLCFAPIEDEANFDLYQGGRRAYKPKSKASGEFEEQELVAKAFVPLAERLEQSVLSEEEQSYYQEILESGSATEQDVEYINEQIEQGYVTDEERRLMEEFDREYDDEVAGTKRKRFGFGR